MLIKLENIGKIYYGNQVASTALNNVNLSFNNNEFVAITGESGSGKSTLLNVISGIDTYEEGQMYIEGKETSHYTTKDYEEYRRKYISIIFQNFNLINSYTVYQNIELVLLLNGTNKKEAKKRTNYLIESVGLSKFKNMKVSKLSGGQKQRVAIARALAKDTPIIIADEPTASLDSTSSKEIIKLLSLISKNKLVIIVTHNYEEVSEYITRKIKIHDGRVIEDAHIVNKKEENTIQLNPQKKLTLSNKFKLGLRNAFNIFSKFSLILFVYLFVILAFLFEYSSFRQNIYLNYKNGYNYLFNDTNDKRIVIKKQDKSPLTEEDYEKINKIANIDSIIRNDIYLDNPISVVTDGDYWLSLNVNEINNFKNTLDLGTMPKNDNEVILTINENDIYIENAEEMFLNKNIYLTNDYSETIDKSKPLIIKGIKYTKDIYTDGIIYISNNMRNDLVREINKTYSITYVHLSKNKFLSTESTNDFRIVARNNVPSGEVYISKDYNAICGNNNCLYEKIIVTTNNIYYDANIELVVKKTYDESSLKLMYGNIDYSSCNGEIYINPDDYNKLFNSNTYQSSIIVKDAKYIDDVIDTLNESGFKTLKIADTLIHNEGETNMQMIRTIVTIILILVLFLISYVVIKIIIKSRNIYFTILRILGFTKESIFDILLIELLTIFNIAYIIIISLINLNNYILKNIVILNLVKYISIRDYIVIYIICIFISFLISLRISSYLFKKSANATIREDV